MGKVFRHKPAAPDEYLGRVDPVNGKVYRHRRGLDEYLGQVELDTGKVYSHRHGPDKYLGQVHLYNGKIYRHRPGPDQYVARVKPGGRIYRHKPVAPDKYLGDVERMHSLAEGGAAFFLLLSPAVEEIAETETVEETKSQGED